MNPTIVQEITLLREFLAQQEDLGIVIGAHMNLDTVAAALSLYLTLSQSGKKVQIISKKEPTVEVSSLVGIDRIKENFVGNTGKLVVALPYIKGEVEKVLFTEAPNTINFHLTAAPDKSITPFDLSDVKLIWEGGAPSAIIAVGVGTVDEFSGIVDANTTKIVNIDNFQGNGRFGDVVLVDESFSSLSEIVGKIIKDLQLPMDLDIAQNILDGVLFATRNFTKPNTSPLAFEAVSSAMYVGAQRKADDTQSQPQPQQQQPRRDQGFTGQNQRQNQQQDRGQNRDRQQQQPRQPRVSDTDFPAMHMQQRPPQPQNAPQFNDQRRSNNQNRGPQGQNNPQRTSQQFGQDRSQQPRPRQDIAQRNSNDDVDALLEKIKAENAKYAPVQDAQIVSEPQMDMNTAPVEDVQIPEETPYVPSTPDEIPDDWLMPKVFKSSKNNN